MQSPFRQILASIREASITEKDKGTRFELLVKRYLETDPVYRDRFSQVWMWMDWPYRNGKIDQGIDLVAREAVSGEYCAIQCKCYDENHLLALPDVGTFFASLHMQWPTDLGRLPFANGMIVATTDKWNLPLSETIDAQSIPCSRISLSDLENSPIDWAACAKTHGVEMPLQQKHQPRPHQREAIDKVLEGFRTQDRGKLIMACGTGKTFTALKLAEEYTQGKGLVLFLVPSIALLSQSLREWTAQCECPMYSIAVCSDSKASSLDDAGDLTANDLPAPACTDPQSIARQYAFWSRKEGMIVVFSTYQSIDVISKAQKLGNLPEFDLIICDEAHRTTGVSLKNEKKGGYDESAFVRVHDAGFLKASRRLYMTATPRIYTENSKKKAEEGGAIVASMDDLVTYGPEFHRLPFSRAVRENLLSDYKVLVLCVDEAYVREVFKKELQDDGNELKLDDAVKLLGCYNGLRKKMYRIVHSAPRDESEQDSLPAEEPDEDTLAFDPAPMRRAVAFAGRIADSKSICGQMNVIVDQIAVEEQGRESFLPCEIRHVDGTMNTQERNDLLGWLKEDAGERHCRVLSNARCLSEGVDVPALDAVMFLSPRRSQVDIVQSVGRVMRRSPGKQYGYIILPIGIPEGKTPEEVLDNDEKYGVVWDVLQALRAHDDRFNAEINKIDLNKGHSSIIDVVDGTGKGTDRRRRGKEGGGEGRDGTATGGDPGSGAWLFPVGEWREAILARVVKKCGDRRYWDTWAKDIAAIAERQMAAIGGLLQQGHGAREFDSFLSGLRNNINPNISRDDAIEMLAQQVITRPVFDALFDAYPFAEQNPVSRNMNRMLELVQEKTSGEDAKKLTQFYESVKERAAGIDNAEGRQKVIVELYDKFFKNAFPRMADKLGIVYTPIEIVDFIIHSVHAALKKEFGLPKGLAENNVRILDPFTGTGTFIVRLIQSGLIHKKDLPRKYRKELFACEIVLLAYYIACVNIEEAYHGVMKTQDYESFEGLCLTDTFQMGEKGDFLSEMFSENAERVQRLNSQDIRVIMSNPPYSVGQKSANDNNQNQTYPALDERIEKTYAKQTQAGLLKGLYDSYIRAFRWASDRITEDGIVAFVTNGSFIDKNAMSGFRKTLLDEFSSVYCFNLRGFIRGKSGLDVKKEGQNVFNIMTGVCITILVKKKGHSGPGRLFYHDIGDYLSREEKFSIIREFKNIDAIPWKELMPDEHGDWICHRDPGFNNFIALGDKKNKGKEESKTIFSLFSLGVATNRDAWCYNYSRESLARIMNEQIQSYNEYVEAYRLSAQEQSIEDFVDDGTYQVKWTRALRNDCRTGKLAQFSKSYLRLATYRPYTKQNLYFSKQFNEAAGLSYMFFPTEQHENLVICLPGLGSRKNFSCLISNAIMDLEVIEKGQCFPLYWYEKKDKSENPLGLDLDERKGDYIRHNAITDFAWRQFRQAYGDSKITREDIFYYVYGILHSPEYRERFESNLKKELPRIPYAKDFWAFSKAGKELAQWHLNYETVDPWPVTEESHGDDAVEKMKFPKKEVKDIIIYNKSTIIKGIPLEAYEYIVNGKSAIEWVMERYQVKTDKDSGILNDPNEWRREHGNSRYILDLLKRVIRVSVETVRVIKSLPPLEEIN